VTRKERRRRQRLARARVILGRLGWRVNTDKRLEQAIEDYQRVCNISTARVKRLKITGNPNARTMRHLEKSERRRTGRKGYGTISRHFDAVEFACKCGGRYAACRRIWATRRLVKGLEASRKRGMNTRINSGCRCYGHNKAVGGASASRHLKGEAADVPPSVKGSRVRSWGIWNGVGIVRRTGLALHVDHRPYDVIWYYA
jgi:hypothetical protein